MQDYPGAPGSARPGNTGTDMPAACGGAAVQPLPQAPDHHRSSAAPMPKAPGHIRPCAASMPMAPGHIRPRATSMPKALGHNRPRAASMASPGHADAGCGPASAGRRVPLTTAPVPAHASRLLRIVLLRVAATPRTLTDPQSYRLNRHSRESGNPRSPRCYGGTTGGATHRQPALRIPKLPPTRHPHSTTHQVHPAIQVPTRPPPATAGTGCPRQRHSRAPPPSVRHSPSLTGRGPGGRSARLPSPGACSRGRVSEGATSPPRSCADAPRATRRPY